MTLRLDFANQDYFRDPAANIERLRAAGPVVQVKFPIIGSAGDLRPELHSLAPGSCISLLWISLDQAPRFTPCCRAGLTLRRLQDHYLHKVPEPTDRAQK